MKLFRGEKREKFIAHISPRANFIAVISQKQKLSMRKTWQNLFSSLAYLLFFEKRKLQSIRVMEKPFSRMFCKTATAVLAAFYL